MRAVEEGGLTFSGDAASIWEGEGGSPTHAHARLRQCQLGPSCMPASRGPDWQDVNVATGTCRQSASGLRCCVLNGPVAPAAPLGQEWGQQPQVLVGLGSGRGPAPAVGQACICAQLAEHKARRPHTCLWPVPSGVQLATTATQGLPLTSPSQAPAEASPPCWAGDSGAKDIEHLPTSTRGSLRPCWSPLLSTPRPSSSRTGPSPAVGHSGPASSEALLQG